MTILKCSPPHLKSPFRGVGGTKTHNDPCRSIGHRSVRDVRVSRDPTHVGGAPVHVVVVVVERVFECSRCVQHVARSRVQHAFGLSRGPAEDRRAERHTMFSNLKL